eukprot:m.170523 g.170523  ORF g.170523 m.170523 type:complete len:938 (-) comp25154_c1_seq4:113-2926(-)
MSEFNQEPSMEDVVTAVRTLHHNPDRSSKLRAGHYLEEFQKSVFAWELADKILHGKISLEASCFAAQTMRSKIQYHFGELPPDSHFDLRDSLLEHIKSFSSGVPLIVTQLCLAIADLIIQMEGWPSFLQDLISLLGEDVDTVNCLLELLCVIPEELDNPHVHVSHRKRKQFSDELNQSCGIVYEYLNVCMDHCQQDLDTQNAIFKCLTSWLKFGGPGAQSFIESALLPLSFQAIKVEETSETACDVACSAVYLSVELPALRPIITPLVFELDEVFKNCADDLNLSQAILSVFLEYAECSLNLMVEELTDENDSIVQLILDATEHPQIEIVHMTFSFWYRLSEFIDVAGADEEDESRIARVMHYAPFFHRLLSHITVAVRCPENLQGLINYHSELADFRSSSRHMLQETSYMSGSRKSIELLLTELHQDGLSWQQQEACLYVACAFAENVDKRDQTVMPYLIEFLMNLGDDVHIQMRYTSVKLLGRCSVWIAKNPDSISPVFTYVLSGLELPELSRVNVFTIRNLCLDCKDKMGPHFGSLVQVIEAADSLGLSKQDIQFLYEGAAKVQSSLQPQEINQAFNSVAIPLIEGIHSLVSDSPDSSEIEQFFSRLCILFKNTRVLPGRMLPNGAHPCLEAGIRAWDTASYILASCGGNTALVEDACHCVKYILECLQQHAAELMPQIAELVGPLYQAQRNPALLYVASSMIDVFAINPEYADTLGGILISMCHTTFAALETVQTLEEWQEHQDILLDFFRLLTRTLERQPMLLLQYAEETSHSVTCAVAAMLVPERDVNESVTTFLQNLVACPRIRLPEEDFEQVSNAVTPLLQEMGEAIVHQVVATITGALPTFLIPNVSFIMWEFVQFDLNSTVAWVQSAPGFQEMNPAYVTEEDKLEFLNSFAASETKSELSRALRKLGKKLSPDYNIKTRNNLPEEPE